jgi:hypothetical protein
VLPAVQGPAADRVPSGYRMGRAGKHPAGAATRPPPGGRGRRSPVASRAQRPRVKPPRCSLATVTVVPFPVWARMASSVLASIDP